MPPQSNGKRGKFWPAISVTAAGRDPRDTEPGGEIGERLASLGRAYYVSAATRRTVIKL
jgi:hypothetical protein